MKFWQQTNSGNQLYNKTKLIDVLNKNTGALLFEQKSC